MKQIPLYSLVIFPSSEQSKLIKSYKQLLKSHIPEGFGSANSLAHITIIHFLTDLDYMIYIDQIREFCKTIASKKITFDSWGKFEKSGTFFLCPNEDSKIYLNSIIINLHKFLGFKTESMHVNAHMSIGRKLFSEKMEITEKVFKDIKPYLFFNSNALYVRKFNYKKMQYSDIIERINFDIEDLKNKKPFIG
jgi:2'-5' RNA ligase